MSPNEPARRQTDLAGVKLMLGWVRAAGFDSILATGNDAVETWRVRARCLHAPEAALTFCVLMLLAASQATPGPRVQRISSHTLAQSAHTRHAQLIGWYVIAARQPHSASPPQPRAAARQTRNLDPQRKWRRYCPKTRVRVHAVALQPSSLSRPWPCVSLACLRRLRCSRGV